MSESNNPYLSSVPVPQDIAPANTANTLALRRLRIPSIVILVISGIFGTFGLVQFPFIVTMLVLEIYGVRRWGGWHTGDISLGDKIFLLILHVSQFIIVIGSWRMVLGKNYRLSYIAAVLSSIPFLSSGIVWGIPFGIWALIILHRKDVKDAFAIKAGQSEGAAKNAG